MGNHRWYTINRFLDDWKTDLFKERNELHIFFIGKDISVSVSCMFFSLVLVESASFRFLFTSWSPCVILLSGSSLHLQLCLPINPSLSATCQAVSCLLPLHVQNALPPFFPWKNIHPLRLRSSGFLSMHFQLLSPVWSKVKLPYCGLEWSSAYTAVLVLSPVTVSLSASSTGV